MTYSTLNSDCITLISFNEVTHSLHFSLQMLHLMLIALLPYCNGLSKTVQMQYGE